MKKSCLAPVVASALLALAGTSVLAQSAPSPVTGNAGLYSDYRFRGFTQTGYNPAFQGGFDYSHASGFYLGNWNSNVKETLYNGASLEMDFYGGFKGSAGKLGYDLGLIYYAYPGSGDFPGSFKVDNTEIYGGLSYGPFSGKLFYAVSDYFKAGRFVNGESTKGTTYLDLAANFDIGGGWTLNTHVGILSLKKNNQFTDVDGNTLSKNVTDYKIGVTKDLSGYALALAVFGTSKKGYFSSGLPDSGTVTGLEAGGKTGAVLSISKSF
jgi:uncharacterized protein (TIGR02001 family)